MSVRTLLQEAILYLHKYQYTWNMCLKTLIDYLIVKAPKVRALKSVYCAVTYKTSTITIQLSYSTTITRNNRGDPLLNVSVLHQRTEKKQNVFPTIINFNTSGETQEFLRVCWMDRVLPSQWHWQIMRQCHLAEGARPGTQGYCCSKE